MLLLLLRVDCVILPSQESPLLASKSYADCFTLILTKIYRQCGRGTAFGCVVSVCVRVSVMFVLQPLKALTDSNLIFKNITVEFVYQGHRVEVKVTVAKNWIYERVHKFAGVPSSIKRYLRVV